MLDLVWTSCDTQTTEQGYQRRQPGEVSGWCDDDLSVENRFMLVVLQAAGQARNCGVLVAVSREATCLCSLQTVCATR